MKPGVPSGDRGNGNKNRDDFHCLLMRLMMSICFIFGDDLSDEPS